MDAYFLEFDFDAAKQLAEGAAVARIEHDLALAALARDQGALSGARSSVYYSSPERRALSEDRREYVYQLEVRNDGEGFSRPIRLMLARRDAAWRVIAFRELTERVGEPGEDPGFGVRTGTGAAAPPHP